MKSDQGARNLIHVFVAVIGLVTAFYGYLAWRAFSWNPMFFIRDADSKRELIASKPISAITNAASRHPSVGKGERLYLSVGCAVCHGVAGRGGVRNPNYVKDDIPALNILAERMFLNEPEDVELVIEKLDSGQLGWNAEDLNVPRAEAVLAQYESVRTVIMSGNPAGKKDSTANEPLDMPKWNDRLTGSEVNALIAYLLSLYPWDAFGRQ